MSQYQLDVLVVQIGLPIFFVLSFMISYSQAKEYRARGRQRSYVRDNATVLAIVVMYEVGVFLVLLSGVKPLQECAALLIGLPIFAVPSFLGHVLGDRGWTPFAGLLGGVTC